MLASMTYGTLPSRNVFDAAFDRNCPNGTYSIRLGFSDSRACDGFQLGDGDWTSDQLWSAITEIVKFNGDPITVSENEEYEDVYLAIYPGTDRAPIEVGPDTEDLIEWAQKFSKDDLTTRERAIEALNFAAAYGETGYCFIRHEAVLDLVSSIMETLGFEWI